jgi:hypothetical protein
VVFTIYYVVQLRRVLTRFFCYLSDWAVMTAAAVAETVMMAAEMVTETAAIMTVNGELVVCEERVGRHCLLQLNQGCHLFRFFPAGPLFCYSFRFFSQFLDEFPLFRLHEVATLSLTKKIVLYFLIV